MSEHESIRAEELHAYVDGELPQSRRAEIDRILAHDATLAAKVAAFKSDKATLARAYGGLEDQELPREWIDTIERGPASRRSALVPTLTALAASLVLLVVGSAVVRNGSLQGSVVNEALSVRDNIVAPNQVIAWRADERLADASPILERTLAMKARVPDLSGMGYRLTAIQLYRTATNDGSVELVYRGQNDRDFTLYVRRSPGKPRFDVFEQAGVRVCVWQDEVVSTVMAGRMSAAEMQRLASLAYNGLNA